MGLFGSMTGLGFMALVNGCCPKEQLTTLFRGRKASEGPPGHLSGHQILLRLTRRHVVARLWWLALHPGPLPTLRPQRWSDGGYRGHLRQLRAATGEEGQGE